MNIFLTPSAAGSFFPNNNIRQVISYFVSFLAYLGKLEEPEARQIYLEESLTKMTGTYSEISTAQSLEAGFGALNESDGLVLSTLVKGYATFPCSPKQVRTVSP